jgi:hypothetical protein
LNWPALIGVLVVTSFVAREILMQRKAVPATADTVDASH